MFKGIEKQKKELAFAITTLVLSLIFFGIAVWSFKFLARQIGSSLEEPKVSEGETLKFNLEEFDELGLEY